jgi:transcriptional regulator with XRE-family HTH domain
MKKIILLPKHSKLLIDLGEKLKLARLRRKLSSEQVSERAGITRSTLINVEKGSPTTSIGIYLQVMVVLGLYEDFTKLASDDELGRKLQDANILIKKRVQKKGLKNE